MIDFILRRYGLIGCITVLLNFCAPLPSAAVVSRDRPSVPAPQVVDLGNAVPAQQFEGIGAVFSYEKLFYDYPEKQRNEILDYLFLPAYGAALQILKVEIGYDGNNTATAWPAHQRTLAEKPRFHRGFVWWLMKEAKRRNPGIRLAALHWGYPAYARTDALKADFIFGFVEGARKVHNLKIDYIGGNQNESALTPEVTKLLRKRLDNSGFKDVKIIAADEGARVTSFQVLKLLEEDPDYRAAVDIIGIHYKGRPADFMPKAAYLLNKPIWSSEDGGGTYKNNRSGYNMIEQFMKLFVDLKFTATAGWLATASAYENMPWPAAGVIMSRHPWSGHYIVGAGTWAIAHVTQFTKPGWQVLELEDSYLYGSQRQRAGRYMGFTNKKTGDYSILLNTMQGQFPEEGMDITIKPGDFKSGDIHVWRSDFTKPSAEWMVKQAVLQSTEEGYTIHLDKNCIYTITTTTGQHKGTALAPAPASFALPYKDDFESYQPGTLPRYFVDASGGFEVASGSRQQRKNVLRQVVADAPKLWHFRSRPIAQPLTETGDIHWKDYKVSVDVLLEQPGGFWLGGRFDGKEESNGEYLLEGYWVSVDDLGRWKLFRKDPQTRPGDSLYKGPLVLLASGKEPAIGTNRWFSVGLEFRSSKIFVYINSKRVAQQSDSIYKNGNIALGGMRDPTLFFFEPSQKYLNFQIDNFLVQQ